MVNRTDGLVEYYQARTLIHSVLTQRVVHTIGHRRLLRIRLLLLMLQYSFLSALKVSRLGS
jgi:hypothetical protein